MQNSYAVLHLLSLEYQHCLLTTMPWGRSVWKSIYTLSCFGGKPLDHCAGPEHSNAVPCQWSSTSFTWRPPKQRCRPLKSSFTFPYNRPAQHDDCLEACGPRHKLQNVGFWEMHSNKLEDNIPVSNIALGAPVSMRLFTVKTYHCSNSSFSGKFPISDNKNNKILESYHQEKQDINPGRPWIRMQILDDTSQEMRLWGRPFIKFTHLAKHTS